jgi:hypothetical protein
MNAGAEIEAIVVPPIRSNFIKNGKIHNVDIKFNV